ncbi:hypothetical protein PsorP6_003623 [Peronosclerospora sorghi]|uniref:Uncharacterized protein n=1 Tax=Peronosclerospora sorghi TaxID=230839 RepID=A0ACC0VNQ2_9STRA|nr:hypothetical protein PsorP6_003623 [Peronosclerospora sorghi]
MIAVFCESQVLPIGNFYGSVLLGYPAREEVKFKHCIQELQLKVSSLANITHVLSVPIPTDAAATRWFLHLVLCYLP